MLFREQVEADTSAGPPTLLRCVAKELRGPAAPLTPPLVHGLNEIARLKRAAEARLVHAAAKQELVYRLQVAEGECRGEQAKGDGRLVNALPNNSRSAIDDRAMTGSQGGKGSQGKPFRVVQGYFAASGRQCGDADGHISVAGMAPSVT